MKPVVAAILMFCSLWFLTKDIRTSAIGMAIPLVLGWFNFASQFAYFLTMLAFTLAIGTVILPDRMKTAISHAILAATTSQQEAPATLPATNGHH